MEMTSKDGAGACAAARPADSRSRLPKTAWARELHDIEPSSGTVVRIDRAFLVDVDVVDLNRARLVAGRRHPDEQSDLGRLLRVRDGIHPHAAVEELCVSMREYGDGRLRWMLCAPNRPTRMHRSVTFDGDGKAAMRCGLVSSLRSTVQSSSASEVCVNPVSGVGDDRDASHDILQAR